MNLSIDKIVALTALLLFLLIFFFARRRAQFSMRPIPGYTALKNLLAQSIETHQPIHLSLGIAGIGDRFTADTTAALQTLDYLADGGARGGVPPLVTCAHPTALPVALDILQRAAERQGYALEFDPTRARWIAPDPSLYASGQNDAFAYAAGTMRLLNQQPLIANVMIGNFGDEFLLMGELGAQKNLTQIGGTSATRVLPFFQTTMTHTLIGEEIYAAGAYLSNRPAHVASLAAQDFARWLIVAGTIAAVVLRTLGLI
jgi:hypothetical protein